MGNRKFRLSDMIPNAWFYKLKEMGNRGGNTKRMKKTKPYYQHYTSPSPPCTPHKQNPPLTPNRASYYISRRLELDANKLLSPSSAKAMDNHFTLWEPPRKSKRRTKRRHVKPVCSPRPVNSTIDSSCGCRVRKPEPESETDSGTDWSQPCCTCRVTTSPTDIIIDVTATERVVSKKLPPIITKQQSPEAKPEEKSPTEEKKSPPKEVHRIKTRVKSPRVLTKKTKHRKSNAKRKECGNLDGFAVVKSSSDPQRDFRESMIEMIVENNICKTKDLEELLACYLSLNSAEYHNVIVKVFEQIWFDLTNVRS
ncbi:transcription repressor [Rhynchospora pubera]|uniref:Transcription repressor n=1 Tax=Rhynchospora pubera TaxID=906938 RepID=A0AAV8F1J5_9POAL|nr:transcription repressor [Rhynchospora pubera]